MRIRTLGAVLTALFVAGPVMAGETTSFVEIVTVGGMTSGPGSGRDPAAWITVAIGPSWARVTGSGAWVGLHKQGTPGGYQTSTAVGGQIFLGSVFVHGGINRSHADQTVWTKDIEYAYGGIGYRWLTDKETEQGLPVELNEFSFTYYEEIYSTYANDTKVYRFTYAYEHRLGSSPVNIRLAASIGGMYFNQGPEPGAAKRKGGTGQFTVGFSFRPYWR